MSRRSIDRIRILLTAEPPTHEAHALALLTRVYDCVRPGRLSDVEQALRTHAELLELLEENEPARHHMAQAFAVLLRDRNLIGFFTDSGIPRRADFFGEIFRIVVHRLLPELPDEHDLRGVVHAVFHHPDDWAWMSAIPCAHTQRLWRLLADDGGLGSGSMGHLLDQLIEAMLVIAWRISSVNSDHAFRRLGPEVLGHGEVFRSVAIEAQRLADAWRSDLVDEVDEAPLLEMIDRCQDVVRLAHDASALRGTSLSLTALLDRVEASLERLHTIATLLASSHAPTDSLSAASWHDLTCHALRAENDRDRLRAHLDRGLRLLALRVTENAAKSGEHYIALDQGSYRAMWWAASAGGVLIALMAGVKILAASVDAALLGRAVIDSLVYGGGFVVIYLLHWTVATKQPAMTAQTLARHFGQVEDGRAADASRLVSLVAAVSRTQLAAILGNVLVAAPLAFALVVGWQSWQGHALISHEKAWKLMGELNPLGAALPHAAIAGFYLFLSGIIAGTVDNYTSYARIGQRVARLSWLNALMGRERADGLGRTVDARAGGVVGNFLFGVMLGSTGVLGVIAGLPLDIRHVAFSSANFGYAVATLGVELPWTTAVAGALCVLAIGAVNLSVSFTLALFVALRARGLVFTRWRRLARVFRMHLRERPAAFLWPPTGPAAAPEPKLPDRAAR